MTKGAIVVLAGTESHDDLGRLTNALQTAKEFKEADDELVLVFDGAGTQWIPELEAESHAAHALYETLKPDVQVGDYCADAFHVGDAIDASDAERVAEFEGHPSLRELAAEGYTILTF